MWQAAGILAASVLCLLAADMMSKPSDMGRGLLRVGIAGVVIALAILVLIASTCDVF